jgi:hypothetical protein
VVVLMLTCGFLSSSGEPAVGLWMLGTYWSAPSTPMVLDGCAAVIKTGGFDQSD